MMEVQRPYTEEQYQRCLKEARKMSYAISDIKKNPLTPELLIELIKSGDEFEKILLDVVNETCDYQ